MIYEVEKRSLISQTKAKKIISFLNKRAKKINVEHRFAFIYMDNPQLIPNKNDPVDLRVKVTNKQAKITLKYGSWHASTSREEYEVEFSLEELSKYLHILMHLGKKWGTTNSSTRLTYIYNGITLTIDKHEDFPKYIIEMEIVCNKKSDLKMAENNIDQLMSNFSVQPLDSDGMVKFVYDLKDRKKWQFDFTKKSIDKYLETWKELIHIKL